MNQPTGERRVTRDAVTTTTRRGAREHNRHRAGALLPWLGVGAAALAIGGPLLTMSPIQNDLSAKVERAAAAAGFQVEADFSGQDGTISCTGPVDRAALERIGEAIKGVRKIGFDDATCNDVVADESAATTVAAAPEPAVTEPAGSAAGASQLLASAVLARGAAGVVLSGVVDSEAQHEALVDAATAAFGAGNVTDRLTVAGIDATAGDVHVAGLAELIGAMKDDVVEGEAGFDGTSLYLKGVYPDASTKDALDAVIGDLGIDPGNVELSLDTSVPPAAPVTFAADAALAADGTITLTGIVPNEAARKRLVDAAGERAGAANVIDRLTLSAADDDPGVDRLARMIAAMPPNLAQGSAGWDGNKFYAKGQYLSEASKAAFEQVATDVGVAPADLAVEPRPAATIDQATELEQELNDLVGLSPIPFDAGKSSLRPEAASILDKVAGLAKKYAGVSIAVNGHTDTDGSAAGNQTLSESRANTVRDSLIGRGVPAEQLTAQGFGESQPVAPNDTPENKAKNRRVVFTVVKQ